MLRFFLVSRCRFTLVAIHRPVCRKTPSMTDTSGSFEDQRSDSKPSLDDVEATPGGEKVDEHDEKHSSPDDGVPPAPFSLPREIAFVLMICLAQFLSLASLAQSIAPMEIIGRSFGLVSEAELSWFPASFSLTYGTFILPAGRLVSESHNHWKADTLTDQQ